MSIKSQPGILEPIPDHARYIELTVQNLDENCGTLTKISQIAPGDKLIIGLGQSLCSGVSVPGLKDFPDFESASALVPATQCDLWICVRGNNPGEVALRSMALVSELGDGLSISRQVDGFKFDTGRDLTGYEDGTENPQGSDAQAAAIVENAGAGMDGASFVVIQQWQHDFVAFEGMSSEEQDNAIGRHRESNEEFDAPPSAHVKRTAQESFDPEAFMVRRSLPWSDAQGSGLVFVAFASSFYPFEVQMNKMIGIKDGIVDGLFQFSRPITGSYYWCPPIDDKGCLDISMLQGLEKLQE